MTDDEYQRIKDEIGWHFTAEDVWLIAAVVALIWLCVVLA